MKNSKKGFVVFLTVLFLSLANIQKAEARKVISQSSYSLQNGCAMITTTYGYYLFGILLWTSEESDTVC
ncbi:MAG: hypothetical protein MUC49_14880 [Raineya sp.]|jgi:hypothetical protein|nr:hypothetical protein [Raineya sp.]